MQTSYKRERLSFFLVLGIFALVALNLALFPVKIDLTSTGKYSIAPETKTILQGAQNNIYVTYYVSKEIRARVPMPDEVENFLYQYAGVSGGKVKVQILDPSSKPEVLMEAKTIGLQATPIDLSQMSTTSYAEVFSGIQVTYLDKKEILPMVTSTDTLEYELTAKIKKLFTGKTRSVGILLGNRQLTLDNAFQYTGGQVLPSLGTFRLITPGEPIENLDLLIVAGNESLTEYDVFQVDQFLMKGGKVFFASEGVNLDFYKLTNGDSSVPLPQVVNYLVGQGRTVQANPAMDKPLNKLLEKYGVRVIPQLVLDSKAFTWRIQDEAGIRNKSYVPWIQVDRESVAKDHLLTSNWPGLMLYWPSALEVTPKDGQKAEVLVSTSPAGALKGGPFELNANILEQQYRGLPEKKAYPLVVSVSGKFNSGFTKETIPVQPGVDPAKIQFQAQSPETRILVAGSSLFFSDVLTLTKTTGNLAFLTAAVDWLSQDDDLLKIKTRPFRDPLLTGLSSQDAKGGWTFWMMMVNVILIPGIIIVWAVMRQLNRRKWQQ